MHSQPFRLRENRFFMKEAAEFSAVSELYGFPGEGRTWDIYKRVQ